MRLALATAFLAQSLPAASSVEKDTASNSDTAILERHHVADLRRALLGRGESTSSNNSRDKVNSDNASTKERFITSLKERLQLKVLKNTVIEGLEECDPESTEKEPDTGVLSCGAGKYCVESSFSSKGGACVSSPDDLDAGLQMAAVRNLQSGDDFWNNVNTLFCDPASEVAPNCECSNADADADLLEVSCTEPEDCSIYTNTCDANITNCVIYSFTLNLTGPGTYDYLRCFEDTEPYIQKTCYAGSAAEDDILDECMISVDDTTCNMCVPTQDEVEICDFLNTNCYNVTQTCFEFDCTNTLSRKAGNTCDDGVYIPPILYYLQTYGCEDLYVCPICGGETFVSTNPGGIIDLGQGATTCAAVAQVALLGGFNETFCQDVVIPGVKDDCGCTELTPTAPPATPTSSPGTPTETPAMSPTDAPSEGSTLLPSQAALPSVLGLSVWALFNMFEL